MTKEPDAQRQKLEPSASCFVPEPRSTAGLVVDLRRCEQENESEAAGGGVSVVPGSPTTGAANNDDLQNKQADDSDLEHVGSSSSGLSDDWHPQPREATLEGPSFETFAAQLNNDSAENKVPLEAKVEKPENKQDALEEPDSPPAGGSDKLLSGRTCKIEPWSGLPRGPDNSLE